jgi:hypothetical protein
METRSAMRNRAALPTRIVFTVAHLWCVFFTGVALVGRVYLERHMNDAVQHLTVGILGIGLAMFVGLGLTSIWRKR